MQWFQGKIPDAIQLSKQRGSLFIVYVYGQDEQSGQMNSTWDDEAVTSCMQDLGAVAIRIENTSDECKFFSQIYPVVVVPSTFCIGDGGIPLEVIGGNMNPEDFVNKLKQVEQMHAAQKASAPPNTGQTSEEPATASASSSDAASGDQASGVTLDEKVQKAKELLEKTKEVKAQKEFEKGHEEEMKRRKLGQDLVQLKKNQQESQMKELKDQMRKDKEEEKKAKEKIRQQIARDREERQAKYKKEKQERDKVADEKKREKLVEQQKQAAAEEAKRSETARIQVRLPDGSSVSQSFPSSDTLQSLHNFISQKTGQNMTLSTTFPKRRFTEEDKTRTFVDLELAPSAVVIALPKGHEEEMKRRKLGQDLVQLKKNQQESQMKELKDQMRKDKEEEKKAKEKIRQQIARDREERQAKYKKEKQERDKVADEKKREKLVEQQKQAAAEEAKRSETARIQVRLPDGSSVSQSFPSSDTLQSLHNFISQKTGQNMTLSTTFPKRRFTEEDKTRTFVDLELAPSAVVIALPAGRTQRQASSSTVQSHGFAAWLFSPFFFFFNFLYTLVFGSGNRGGENDDSTTPESQSSQPDNTSQSTRRTDRPTTAYQRRSGGGGRVRRLHDMADDDEDMSTYNGNSTQQL